MLFNHTASELTGLCGHALDLAKNMGAAAAEADFSESIGQSVSVRLGEIEQIEFQQDKSLDITVYVGKRKGRASTADFSEKALQDTVKAMPVFVFDRPKNWNLFPKVRYPNLPAQSKSLLNPLFQVLPKVFHPKNLPP